MKLFKYIALSSVLALSMSSCTDWLDVNVNPDSPNSESLVLANRLPWMQKFYQYFEGPTNMRTSCISNVYYSSGADGQFNVTWNCQTGRATTSYQIWFVGCSANYPDTYKRAEKEGAYHYMAAANVIYAMGYMNMVDEYGEMPFTEALGESVSPKYDNGKTIYEGVLAKLDEAIELFGREQAAGATPLSAGDMWCGGNVDKWIKMCYGLKARYLMRTTKKAEWNADDVLAALAKAPQSNADNVYGVGINDAADRIDWLWQDPIQTNGNYDYVSYGNTQRYTEFFVDKLTNMRGAGVVDPRMSKIVPAIMTNVVLGPDGRVQSYEWTRSKGVQTTGDCKRLAAASWNSIQLPTIATKDVTMEYKIEGDAASLYNGVADFVSGFQAMGYTAAEELDSIKGRQYFVNGNVVNVCYPAGKMYVNSPVPNYVNDTIYVSLKAGALRVNNFGQAAIDCNFYSNQAAYNMGVAQGSGSFQTRPISDQDFVTYHEMCFLKAEALFRKGDKGGALTAYKAGIKAHMDRMQTKLKEWEGLGTTNPDMTPMNDAEIEAYLNSAAVAQSAASLTMSDIMLQKFIAMGCSIENWVDQRRFNFSAGNINDYGVIYPGLGRTALFTGSDRFQSDDPKNPQYWVRRLNLPTSLELGYNEDNALAMNGNAEKTWVFCLPVWWDCATDAEYENYLKAVE